MIHNLHVNNVTGQEIAFDLIKILESSPLFTPHPLSREIWNMGQSISLRVAESLVFHPYNDDLICRAMDALSVEASYLYRCEVIFEWIPAEYKLWVTLRQTPPDERTFLFGSYFQKSNQKEPTGIGASARQSASARKHWPRSRWENLPQKKPPGRFGFLWMSGDCISCGYSAKMGNGIGYPLTRNWPTTATICCRRRRRSSWRLSCSGVLRRWIWLLCCAGFS